MSLRLKLILSFVSTSLVVVMVFAAIAYTSAKDYSHHSELNHVNENNLHLINLLSTGNENLEQIERLIPHNESKELFYLIIDSESGDIVSTTHTEQQKKTAAKLLNDHVLLDKKQGLISYSNEHYFWASNPIPGTHYELLSMASHRERGITEFLDYIGNSLAVSIFLALWLSLWAATILANLFQRLANQKMEIEHQSRHDPLTSLPNRQTIGELIDNSIHGSRNNSEQLVLCLIDLNGLKDVNDTLGHSYGDKLLVYISDRLKEVLRSSDRIGRFGGDKFAVVITHSKTTAIEELCNRLLATFDRSFQVDGHDLYLGATLGITCYPEHGEDGQTLIQKAEIALHAAKHSSRDFCIYDVSLDQGNARRLNLAHDLRIAIHEGQLELYYQPQMDLHTGKIISVEALARWNHPEHGFIPPETFISIAEKTGLIKPFTEWVLATAMKQCSEWRKTFHSLSLAVNLSARNLNDETLARQLARLIRHWKIIPEQICLEITETAMMADPEHARLLLEEVDKLGMRISIDDFGTGYSSLSYLKKLPVDEVKIDKSFVTNMGKDENDTSIIRATISLAHDLGLTAVAEGVEDQETLERLKHMGCEIAQGFHICEPGPADQISQFIETMNASASQVSDATEKDKTDTAHFNSGQSFRHA